MAPSACGELCEQVPEDWELGVAGVCNETTGICECPPGYTGVDDWEVFNDCHIPEDFKLTVRYCLIAAAVVQTVVAFITLIYLLRRKGSSWFWLLEACANRCSDERKRYREQQRAARLERAKQEYEMSGTYISEDMYDEDSIFPEDEEELDRELAKQAEFAKNDAAADISTSYNNPMSNNMDVTNVTAKSSNTVVQKELKLLRKSNRRAVILTQMFLSFGISNFCYQISFLFVNDIESKEDNNPFQNFSLAYAVGSIVGGCWYLVYLWYQSLPELKVYVGRVSLAFVVLSYIAFMITMFLFPLLFPSEVAYFDRITLWTIAALVIGALSTLTLVVVMLLRVYHSSLEALDLRKRAILLQEERGEADDGRFRIEVFDENPRASLTTKATLDKKVAEIKRARLTQFALVVLTWFGAGIALALILGCLYIDFMKRNFYIFFTALTLTGTFSALFLNYVVVVRGLRKQSKDAEVEPTRSL